ncbi:MAG TPA: hypothetical protein VLH59_01465 [Ignavibacteriaceae bacterium]|nr:hypothetical protein [Ignavibacteriaceae bacterium]
MKIIKYSTVVLAAFLILLQIGCTHYPVLQEPDAQLFDKTVYSVPLRDSLTQGRLTAGMPRFVASQLFKNYTDGLKNVKIPVATLGSKQRLEEEEGWNRKYVDPNINVFLDKYETSEGRLYVWYQRPDFYRMDVSARDTLCVFYEDTVYCSVINYLNKSSVLTVRDSVPQIPAQTSFYAEVRYNDHPWREISYWYNVEILSNAKTFKLGDTNFEFYPIELLEFNNEPVSSFKWREVNKNED